MNLCNPKHPKHFISAIDTRGRYRVTSWGGLTGDMQTSQPQSFFCDVIIHRNWGGRITAEFEGKFYELFSKRHFCCARHQRDAELLKVARQPWAIQTHPFPILNPENPANFIDGKNPDKLGRAFLLARKLARKNKMIKFYAKNS